MKLNERYDTYGDAVQQLHNTYLELDGDFVHLSHHDGWDFTVQKVTINGEGRRVWSNDRQITDVSEMDLTLDPITLGYINYQQSTYYIQRKPLRKWKQGLYIEYLKVASGSHKGGIYRGAGGNPASLIKSLFATNSVIRMYDNEYPAFGDAYMMVRTLKKNSAAFHREWAFRKIKSSPQPKMRLGAAARVRDNNELPDMEMALDYKGREVGKVSGGNVILQNKFKYLSEAFVEAMVNAS